MSDHDFCRCSLATARHMAKVAKVKLPKKITTWSDGSGQYQMFYEENGTPRDGGYISAHCSFEAKSKFITNKIPDDFNFEGLL